MCSVLTLLTTKWLDLFEVVSINVESGPGWTSLALFKEVLCVNPLLPPNGKFV